MFKTVLKQKVLLLTFLPLSLGLLLAPFGTTYASGGYTWNVANGVPNCNSQGASGDGQYMLCAQGSGALNVSSDYGANFSSVNSGSHDWDAVAVSGTGQYMVGVTDGEDIYMSNDYGTTWTDVYASVASWSSAAISGSGQYISASANGDIYSSADYGATWSQSYSLPSSLVLRMSSSGQYLAAAVGGYNLYTSSDYGATWVADANLGMLNWAGLSVGATGQYMAVADYGGGIYTSDNYGTSWVEQTGAGARNWYGVAISSDGTKLIAADNDVGAGGLYISSDSGQTWTPDPNLTSDSYANPVGSYDLSHEILLGPAGLYYGYNPSFYVSPSQQSSGSLGTSAQTTSNPAAGSKIAAPNTGYAKVAPSVLPAVICFSFGIIFAIAGFVPYVRRLT